jgi:RNA polymerase sigma-70 factor, ECF subfamily
VSDGTSDEQLMLSFKSGEAAAFATLVNRHRSAVFRFILRSVGQPQRAEDVLQETWLKVVRSSHEYEAKAKFTTWLYTIARNLCVDHSRRESSRRFDESLDSPVGEEMNGVTLKDTVVDERVSTELTVHHLKLRPLIEAALNRLPEEQREVFVLREYQGIGFKEIAQIVQVNENTVKSRMRYALESLRKSLTDLGASEAPVLETAGRTVA